MANILRLNTLKFVVAEYIVLIKLVLRSFHLQLPIFSHEVQSYFVSFEIGFIE